MIRLTKLTAFREIPHRLINPPMLQRTIETVRINTNEDLKDPRRIVELTNMMSIAVRIKVKVKLRMEAYWTKKM
ncbi:hypothetical protein WICPIJ_004934 [Wickerhamomyces pijperi]|uniref:Uncharacterized protein n=1 Tax=Wickerhamomyces pijperi TaxID=599730 RepID=A0A9P8TMF1_WICPI|nr:hypothetical protein WICPIJ_004934 [Wickerhamomyces pijperi]